MRRSMRGHHWIAFACAVAWLARAIPAVAAEDARPFVRLELDAGDAASECTTRAELERAVQVQLGKMVFGEGTEPAEATVRVVLERLDAPVRFRASVWLERGTEQAREAARELESPGSCHDLDEELTLVVALLADAELSNAQAAQVSAPKAEVAVAPEPAEPPLPAQDLSPVSSAPSFEARSAGPWTFEVGLGVAAGFGIVPGVGVGLELGASMAPPGWPALALWISGFVPGRADLSSGASVEVAYGQAGLAVCPNLVESARLSLRGCLGIGATLASATSAGLADADSAVRWDLLGMLSLRFGLRWGRGWMSALSLGAGIPTRVYRFTYEDSGEPTVGFEQASIPAWVSLGLVREFR